MTGHIDPGRRSRGSLGQRLHGGLYRGLQAIRGRPVGRLTLQLEAWQRLERPEFERLVRGRLAETLDYAARHVPLYGRKPWSRISTPSLETLADWPVLERGIVRRETRRLIAEPVSRRIFFRYSSASTGPPIRVALDGAAAAWSWANEYRAMRWHGIDFGARTLVLTGNQAPLLDWIRNRRGYKVNELTPELLEQVLRYVARCRPALCWALPSAAFQLARFAAERLPRSDEPLIAFAKLGGEQLYDFQRSAVTEFLGARVIEAYGCTEVGAVAGECREGTLHVFSDCVYPEVLRGDTPAKPGEAGDLVLTSLTNRVMPLVRCRIGDRGRLSDEPCRCGSPLPVLLDLQGRSADVLIGADGAEIHGSVLARALETALCGVPPGATRQILFEQQRPLDWRVLVEADRDLDVELEERLRSIVTDKLGQACRVSVERTSQVPREASGKFRYYRRNSGDSCPQRS